MDLSDYNGLIWLSFLLKNKLASLGHIEYRRTNKLIAESVFNILSRYPQLRTVYFSSGAALGFPKLPKYDEDPYANLKITFQHELSSLTQLSTIYPYATLGKSISWNSSFAAALYLSSLIY